MGTCGKLQQTFVQEELADDGCVQTWKHQKETKSPDWTTRVGVDSTIGRNVHVREAVGSSDDWLQTVCTSEGKAKRSGQTWQEN